MVNDIALSPLTTVAPASAVIAVGAGGDIAAKRFHGRVTQQAVYFTHQGLAGLEAPVV